MAYQAVYFHGMRLQTASYRRSPGPLRRLPIPPIGPGGLGPLPTPPTGPGGFGPLPTPPTAPGGFGPLPTPPTGPGGFGPILRLINNSFQQDKVGDTTPRPFPL